MVDFNFTGMIEDVAQVLESETGTGVMTVTGEPIALLRIRTAGGDQWFRMSRQHANVMAEQLRQVGQS